MFKKFLDRLGLGQKTNTVTGKVLMHTPYREEYANVLYNLLFCDDLALFKNDNKGKESPLWTILLADLPDYAALEQIAQHEEESRIRVLAYNRLREAGRSVPAKQVLGVIVEVPLEHGLDTLAAYADGRARYINHTGHASIFEGGPEQVDALARELVGIAQELAVQIGPWHDKRLPPPRGANVRISMLVSDGLYFGEGAYEVLGKDRLGGPLLAKAQELLQAVVASVSK